MGLKFVVISILFLVSTVWCVDIQLENYIKDMQNLKADFDKIHNSYEETIEENQITDFRNKVTYLIKKFKDQENLVAGAITKSNAEIYRVFNELQRIDSQLASTRQRINENESTRDMVQSQLNRAQNEIPNLERQIREHESSMKARTTEAVLCGVFTLGICSAIDAIARSGPISSINRLKGQISDAHGEISRLQQQIYYKKIELTNLYSTLYSLEAKSTELKASKEDYQNFQKLAVPWVKILSDCLKWLERLQIPLNILESNNVEANNKFKIRQLQHIYATSIQAYEEVMGEANNFFKREGIPVLKFNFNSQNSTQQCSTGWIQHNNACYKMFNTYTTWYEAESNCQKMNAHLASIHSDSEHKFLVDMSKKGHPVSKWKEFVWIGLRRSSTFDHYKWSDDTAVDYNNWDPWALKHLNCVYLKPDHFSIDSFVKNPYWMDGECIGTMRGYVCKMDI